MSSEDRCCLCCLPIVTEVKKKKLINGPKAYKECSVLLSLIASLNVNADSVLKEGNLCACCQRKLLTIERKGNELQELVQKITSYVLSAIAQFNGTGIILQPP